MSSRLTDLEGITAARPLQYPSNNDPDFAFLLLLVLMTTTLAQHTTCRPPTTNGGQFVSFQPATSARLSHALSIPGLLATSANTREVPFS